MKIVENDEFFNTFESKGMTFNQWLDTFEKPENKEKVQQFLKDSESISESYKDKLAELKYKQYLLTIAADWCGDCHRNVPILENICKASEFLELKILKKEDNMDLLVKINGGEKIPYAMFYGKDGYFSGVWSERSKEAYKLIADALKEANYEKNEEFYKSLIQKLDTEKDRLNKSTSDEIVEMILKVNAIQSASARENK